MNIQEEIDYVGRLRDQAVTALSKMLEELEGCASTVPEAMEQANSVRTLIREVHAAFLAVEKSRNEHLIEVTKALFLSDITIAHRALAMFKKIDIIHAAAAVKKNPHNLN